MISRIIRYLENFGTIYHINKSITILKYAYFLKLKVDLILVHIKFYIFF